MSKRNVRLEVRGGQTDTAILRKTQVRICYVTSWRIRYSCAGPRVSPAEGTRLMTHIQPTEHEASFCWVCDPNHMLPYQTCAVANQADVGHGSGACPNHQAAVLQQHISNGTASVSQTGNWSHHKFGTSGTENLQSVPNCDGPCSVD